MFVLKKGMTITVIPFVVNAEFPDQASAAWAAARRAIGTRKGEQET